MVHSEIDHLVWGAPDLDALVARVTTEFGVAPHAGGRHDGRGTRNFLLGLGNGRYLELLGPDPEQPTPAAPRPMGIDRVTSPRMIGWAVRTSEISSLLESSRDSGHDPGTAAPMSRTTPDGTRMEWLLTEPGVGGTLPFVIDWLGGPHPSDGLPHVELTSLVIGDPQPDRIRTALAALQVRDVEIEVAQTAEPTLSAVLQTPRGAITIA